MKFMKKFIAVLMALMLLSGSCVCLAADSEKQYHKYDKVLLLGDSEASGFKDYTYVMTEFTRVDNSYAALIADELGGELIPMACPGFRTVELRYMLDDEYEGDDYLFSAVPHHSPEEIIAKKDDMRQAIKDADLITIGIGGNDWGAYLGWVQEDTLAANILPEEYRTALIELLNNAKVGDDVIGMAIELADYLNAVDELMPALVEAFKYGFSNLYENWEYIIEYIYENNPDVTIAVVGMFPTYLKTEEGAPDVVSEPDPVARTVEDAIISFANKHMIEGRDKYGYLYIDTEGTVVEVCHPTVAGHRLIADRILAALPDARFPYTDITISHKAYKAVEYMYLNGIMSGVDATTFGADTIINEAEFAELLGKVTDYEASGSDKELKKIKMASEVYKASGKNEFLDILSLIVDMIQMIFNGEAFKAVTRADAALAIYNLVK